MRQSLNKIFWGITRLLLFFFQQMKRKFDVVSRQLEVLYDRLRENSVSILRVQLYFNPYFMGISLNFIYKNFLF